MGVHDRCEHQAGRFVAGIAEHLPLVSGAELAVAAIYTPIDAGRLPIEPDLDLVCTCGLCSFPRADTR